MKRLTLLGASLALFASACATSAPQTAAPEPVAADATAMGRLAALATPDNDARRDVIVRQLTSAGFNVAIETFDGGTAGAPETGYNIVATLGEAGSARKQPREILMVAHYDAIQLDGKPTMGIVDNAASVVAMTAAAEKLKSARLKHRVRVLFTDQEELGLLGAKAWIAAHGLDAVAAVVNADVTAYGDTLMYGLNTGEQSRPVLVALERVCIRRAMRCKAMAAYPSSDDVAFAKAGAPVVSIGFQPEQEANRLEAFMVATEAGQQPDPAEFPQTLMLIHTPRDTLDKADPETLSTAAATFEALVRELDRTVR